MATAFKCDKCKSFYTPYHHKFACKDFFDDGRIVILSLSVLANMVTKTELDLCKSCLAELLEYYNQSVLKED